MDANDIFERSHVIDALHTLGGVILDPRPRTIGFERRPLSADRRPTAGPAWGIAPQPRDASDYTLTKSP